MKSTPKVAVIGAGPAGLFGAHFLSSSMEHQPALAQVSLFESHSKPGGTASYFRRKFRGEDYAVFDAAATTLLGFTEGEFLSQILKKLKVPSPKVVPLHSVQFFLDPKQFHLRTNSLDSFLSDLEKSFPKDAEWFKNEIPKLFSLASNLKESLESLAYLPIETLGDLVRGLKSIKLSFSQLYEFATEPHKTFQKWLNEKGASRDFIEFVDMTLKITLQCKSNEALLPWGAFGFCFYLLGVGTPEGGMKAFFDSLLTSLKTKADVHMKEPVKKIFLEGDVWFVETPLKTYGPYDFVFSSIPRFNTERILGHKISPHLSFEELKPEACSAFVGYFVVADDPLLPEEALNLYVKSKEVGTYYTFSARHDTARAPRGFRALTGTTHWSLSKTFSQFSEDVYLKKKKKVGEDFIKRPLVAALPFLQFLFEEYASPETFCYYTKRLEGTVRGIPLTQNHTLWKSPSIRTPYKNLFQIGDTSFPGPSVYGCALGALIACQMAFPKFKVVQ